MSHTFLSLDRLEHPDREKHANLPQNPVSAGLILIAHFFCGVPDMLDIFGKKRREAEQQRNQKMDEFLKTQKEFQERFYGQVPLSLAQELASVSASFERGRSKNEGRG